MLLHTELLIPSMFGFSTHIFHAGFLVFKDVEDFALHCGPLELVILVFMVRRVLSGCDLQ